MCITILGFFHPIPRPPQVSLERGTQKRASCTPPHPCKLAGPRVHSMRSQKGLSGSFVRYFLDARCFTMAPQANEMTARGAAEAEGDLAHTTRN